MNRDVFTPRAPQNGPAWLTETPQVQLQQFQQQAAQTDPDPEPAPETDPADPPADPKNAKDPEGTETDPRAEADKWKALSRKNEEQAKKNAADAKAWREYQDSKKTDDEKREEREQTLAAERDDTKRENALLRLGVKHSLDEEQIGEIAELLEGVPVDQFADRAEKLAARISTPKRRQPDPDPTVGRETPPSGGSTGDWLRDRMTGRA